MSEWQKAYELKNGQRTGRWRWVNESVERDEFYPGRWLQPNAICPPPDATLPQRHQGGCQTEN